MLQLATHMQRCFYRERRFGKAPEIEAGCALKHNKRHRTFPVGTALAENKPSLTALQHPGISPGKEVLFLISSDLYMPLIVHEGLERTPPRLHTLLRSCTEFGSRCSPGSQERKLCQ